MRSFMECVTFTGNLIAAVDAKVAAWQSLLPASKREPLRPDGKVDEIMFRAHEMTAIFIAATHRPLSSLAYSIEEMTIESFASPLPSIEPAKEGRSTHTARALKAPDIRKKLLAIPCAMESNNVFTMCIVLVLAGSQISACNIVLDDHKLSIARERVRLSIGFLNAMGTTWPAREEDGERGTVHSSRDSTRLPSTVTQQEDATATIDLPHDEVIWPIDPSAQIDIYAGLSFPVDWKHRC